MLKQVLLIRHAQSEEDVTPDIRSRVSDRRIAITTTGKNEVLEMVEALRRKISRYRKILVITSPSNRADQTMSLFCSCFPEINFVFTREECIRNLNWGSVDESNLKFVEEERYRVGVLYFQFPDGDNTLEFVKKVEDFVRNLLKKGRRKNHPRCVLIFTHGFALRVIVKAFLGMSDDEFRYLANPSNCYVATLDVTKSEVVLQEPLPKVSFEI